MGIVYLSKTETGAACPPWLAEWQPRSLSASLCHREVEAGHIVGICEPLVFKPANRWVDIDESWSVGRVPGSKVEHDALVRDVLWCDIRAVRDLKDQVWAAPVILTATGGRAFRTAYGKDWLPELTAEQVRAEQIARAARDEFLRGENSALDMSVCCQWAAELLSLTHHLHPAVFSALALLDDRLAPETLGVAAGLPDALEAVHSGN